LIEARRRNGRTAVAGEIAVAEIIGEEDEDVGAGSERGGSGSDGGETETKSGEQKAEGVAMRSHCRGRI
jgi:hypothetical protein